MGTINVLYITFQPSSWSDLNPNKLRSLIVSGNGESRSLGRCRSTPSSSMSRYSPGYFGGPSPTDGVSFTRPQQRLMPW
jgi:hypothetical protein